MVKRSFLMFCYLFFATQLMPMQPALEARWSNERVLLAIKEDTNFLSWRDCFMDSLEDMDEVHGALLFYAKKRGDSAEPVLRTIFKPCDKVNRPDLIQHYNTSDDLRFGLPTLLHVAVDGGSLEFVKLLLEVGANPLAGIDKENGETPLQLARRIADDPGELLDIGKTREVFEEIIDLLLISIGEL